MNGRPIMEADYRRASNALAADRRGSIEGALQTRALDRLIEEELLVQRGVELGLQHSDPRVRATLTDAVIGAIVAHTQDGGAEPTEEDLRGFFQENLEWFRQSSRVRAREVFFSAAQDREAARQRALDVRSRLDAGVAFEVVAVAGDAPVAPLPDALLTLAKVREYLGSDIARALSTLDAGSVAGPIRSDAGYHVLLVLERVEGEQPAFEAVRDLVRREYWRRAGDEALRGFLERRRKQARIEIARGRL